MTLRPNDQPAAWSGQTHLLATGFQRYRAALDGLPASKRRSLIARPDFPRHLTFFTKFDAWCTAAETQVGFMLTNEVNMLGQSIEKLAAWQEVLNTAALDEKHELLQEFVIPLAIYALNLPFALKNRFSFAAMRLADEANQFISPVPVEITRTSDEMVSPKWEIMWRYGSHWNKWQSVKDAVEKIIPNSKNRKTRIESYRDRFVHRIPHYIGLGVFESTKLEQVDQGWKITVSQHPPIELDDIVDELTPVHAACRTTHAAMCELANEQWAALRFLMDGQTTDQ